MAAVLIDGAKVAMTFDSDNHTAAQKRLAPFVLSLKAAILIFATFLSLLGSLGQFIFIERWDAEIGARAAEMRDIEAHVATLRTTQNEYFTSYVQSNLLFAFNPADTSVNKGLVGQMYRLAILDRAFPFRTMMGDLAIAGLFDFKKTYDAYRTLSEAARNDLTAESYGALNTFEKNILDQALTFQGKLQERYFAAQNEKAVAEQARDKRRLMLTVLAALGTVLLLIANLIAVGKDGKKK